MSRDGERLRGIVAHLLHDRGEANEALRRLTEARAQGQPFWSPLACVEAECLAALGRLPEAVAVLEDAAPRDPGNNWIFYGLAMHYRTLGDPEKSLAAMRRGHACLGWQESERNGYVFTHDFFSANIAHWQAWFTRHITMAPIDCLEIGSWQGGSATWLLDKIVGPRGGSLTCIDTFEGSSEHAGWIAAGGRLETLFDANIARTGRAAQCRKLVGRSQDVLRGLQPDSYHFIYIDGAHEAKYVIQDAVLCWPLLRAGGYMLFDDADFTFADQPAQNTQTAIAAFIRWFGSELQVLTPPGDRQQLLHKNAG